MKLLNKTSIYYLLLILPLFAVSSMLIYFFISSEIKKELDESLLKEKTAIVQKLHANVEPATLNTNETAIAPAPERTVKLTVFADADIYDSTEAEVLPFRVLTFFVSANDQLYKVKIQRSYVETEDLVFSILVPIILLFVVMMIGFFFINYWISKRMWSPFYQTIEKLKTFELDNKSITTFDKERVEEFDVLNQSLNIMTKKVYTDYIRQKEFTENASHEIQTPLAIIQNKIEILIQSRKLGDEEMELISGIYDSANRLSHLNKTLLLLTKIENNQFTDNSVVNLKEVITKSISIYKELADHKNLLIKTVLRDDLSLKMNVTLAETLFNNLLLNAIRHNVQDGSIELHLYNNQFVIFNTGKALTTSSEYLFERFKKDTNSKDSTGLGLSIVRSICDLYAITIRHHYEKEKHVFTLSW